jgi:hypothetical protein
MEELDTGNQIELAKKDGPSGFTVDLVESATKEIVDAGQRIISADTWVSFSMDSGVCEAGCRGQ